MDLPPLSTSDPHTDKSQSSKVMPKREEKVSNDDTEIITKVVSEKWKRVQYIRRVGKAWGQVGHVFGTVLNINDENKWGKEMLDECLVKSTKAMCWNLLYTLIILLSSVLFTFPAILIPQQNSLKYPEYWWEAIVPVVIANALSSTLDNQLECKVIFRFEFLNKFTLFLRLYVVAAVSAVISGVMNHLIWTEWLGNNHPIPFLAFISWATVNMVRYVHLWYEFPYELRMELGARKRIRSYFLYRLWYVFYGFQIPALKMIFDKIPIVMQWIMAIILPLFRELNLWVQLKLLENATNFDLTIPLVPKLTTTIGINISHAFVVTMFIANSSTPVTTYSIIAVDFILNLYISHKIIKLHRKIVSSDGLDADRVTKKEETLRLFSIETVEFITPLVYAITFLIAYYGPNATILGNIRNSDFAYKEVEDVKSFIAELIIMFLVDFVSLIISGIMFWKMASINFLQEGYKMMMLYWPLMTVKIGGSLFRVIINTTYI